ncbi:hypothetical protein EIP91_000281 [Steccherinum ochraceum]|uniref:Uncharacterized protein n=1 Tax=Steccherinum ochraceum TaxID=92696 RepID=A0A4R0RGC7_9APHY|nr:hypothetical protein EIP91_000281 [Steccherinum ochraceum]
MGLKSAWGRSELIALGYEGTFKRIRETFVLPDVHYYFNTITRLKGTFHNIHGNGDVDSVLLHPVGWAELVENLESIEVEFGYTDGYAIWDPLRQPKA